MSFGGGGGVGGVLSGDSDVAFNNKTNGDMLTYVASDDKWENISRGASVKDYGAKGDGTTDDAAAIQAAIDAMAPGDSLYFPTGTYVVGTTIQLPIVDGASLIGPVASQVRNPAAVLQAKKNSNLKAIAATQEWLTNGAMGSGVAGAKDAAGITIQGLGFDGGGFKAGSVHNTVIETTSNTLHGLVIHGVGFKLDNVFVVSANGYGIYVPGVGIDGDPNDPNTTTDLLSETHESAIHGCGLRYTGNDGLHVGINQQDSWVEFCKMQYCGGHCIFTDDSCAGWSFIHNHPSWGARDIIHCESGWNYRIADNYIGSVGEYMEGQAVPGRAVGDMRYGIYIDGKPWIVHNNSMNTNTTDPGPPPAYPGDPVTGIYLSGKGVCEGNTLIYQPHQDFRGMLDTTNAVQECYIPDGSNIATL